MIDLKLPRHRRPPAWMDDEQEMCIKWGQSTSCFFTVSYGVRQGAILPSRMVAEYVDDLSMQLSSARS